jgi:sugar (pentulose or hexulose) kinase
MTSDILLGIDLGTSVLKAAAFEARTGRVLAADGVRLPICSDDAGAREQDPRAIDRAFRRLAATLQRRLGRAWSCIAGIGLAAQGGSAILVDRATGRAHTPMQLWNDTRPLHLLPALAARKPPGYWRRLAFLPEPGAGLARIQWLRRRHPRLFTNNSLYVGAGEYVYFHLTGVWRQDAGSALQVGCYDARRRRLTDAPLRLVGVDTSFVAPLRRGHETHALSARGAALLGLPPSVPVAGPYMDHESGYLSAVGTSARPLQCSLGTAWVGNFVLEKGRPPDSGLNLILPSPVGTGSLIVRVMLAGTMTWDWGLATFLDADHAKALTRADALFRRRLLPPPGLIALPWLTRPNLLAPDRAGGGGFFGIGTHTAADDLLRAVAAGMTFEFAHHMQPTIDRAGVDRIVLGGGAAGAWYFRTILAALFAPLPVYHEDVGIRGALYAFSRRVARARLTRVPLPSRAVRDEARKAFDLYVRLGRSLARGLPDTGDLALDPYRQGTRQ